MIKEIAVFKRKPGVTREEFVTHWQNVHAPLAHSDAEFWGRAKKYVQNYVVATAASRQDWDGVVELWWDSEDEMNAAYGSDSSVANLIPDLENFVETASLMRFVVEENVMKSS